MNTKSATVCAFERKKSDMVQILQNLSLVIDMSII